MSFFLWRSMNDVKTQIIIISIFSVRAFYVLSSLCFAQKVKTKLTLSFEFLFFCIPWHVIQFPVDVAESKSGKCQHSGHLRVKIKALCLRQNFQTAETIRLLFENKDPTTTQPLFKIFNDTFVTSQYDLNLENKPQESQRQSDCKNDSEETWTMFLYCSSPCHSSLFN